MHPIAFGLKRAFHSFLNLTRRPLASLGITAARADMLHAVKRAGAFGVQQRDLRSELGVTAPTVSRMLRSLETLGYVVRERLLGDRRRLRVRLTKLGAAVLRAVTCELAPHVDYAFDAALTYEKPWDDDAVFLAMDCTETHLRYVRESFCDRARMHYAWHPDD